MKKKVAILSLIIITLIICSTSYVYATNTRSSNDLETSEFVGELVEIKEKEKKEIEDYNEAYGSSSYGMTAYILNKVRLYSIPFCFIGIAVGAIYQYVIGIRKLDTRDKGFALVIGFVTLLIICQVLPLIFAIVVEGWRG
jgi:hypothetical protein